MDIDQQIIDRAVNIATRCAMKGGPVERVVHIPCASATEDPTGTFCVEYVGQLSAGDMPPWYE
jgi:hypothetical protein